jgi:hypothetical protein
LSELRAAFPALSFFYERTRRMVDFNALDTIFQKYRGKKHGYDFNREIRNELDASLLERLLENLKRKTPMQSEKKHE